MANFFNFALKWQNFCQIWSHCCLTNFQNKNSRKSFSHQKCHADSFEWSLLFYFFCQIKNILKFFYTDNASCTTTPLFQLFCLGQILFWQSLLQVPCCLHRVQGRPPLAWPAKLTFCLHAMCVTCDSCEIPLSLGFSSTYSENTHTIGGSITVPTSDLLFILFGFSCFAYDFWTTILIFWSNQNQLGKQYPCQQPSILLCRPYLVTIIFGILNGHFVPYLLL